IVVDDFWAGATSGRSGIHGITRFDASDLPVKLAGEVDGFDVSSWLDVKEARRTDRFVHFSIASAKLAWEDAGNPEIKADRGGVVFATGIGGIEWLLNQHKVLLEKGPGRVSPFMVPALMANAAAGHIAMAFGLMGPNFCIVSACASGAHAVGEGYRMIRDGLLDLAIVGGSEAATLPLTVAALAIRLALEDAREEPSAVDYVNAHGTSTPLNDASETAALKAALGDEVAHEVAVSSTKSMTGHMLGAAGAVEAAVCALAIQNGVIPPTIHYRTPDPDCDLDYVPNEARQADVRLAISNSFGFSGQNAVLVIRRAS